ncbi:MAG: hypothetical protein COA67_01135 [Lutibacter sp.]|nr:MAG: hypothetical protein COA67_01135 [Lutibacter sp.]
MILSKFKDNSIKRKIERELISSDKPLISISNEKINSILVFVDEFTTKNSSQIIAKELNVDVSKIKIVNYIKNAPKESDSKELFTDKDFNWLGKIKNEYIQNLLNSEFDLLINLSDNNLLLNYLIVLSKAKFKVGFSSADNRLFDFMIAVDTKDVAVFIKELKKYLEILNKL